MCRRLIQVPLLGPSVDPLCLWFSDNVPPWRLMFSEHPAAREDEGRRGGQDKGTGFRVLLIAKGSFVFPPLSLRQVQSLNPTVSPLSLKSTSLGFLACQPCPLKSPPPTFPSASFLFLLQYCTASISHRVWEGPWNGFPSATECGRICDQTHQFPL